MACIFFFFLLGMANDALSAEVLISHPSDLSVIARSRFCQCWSGNDPSERSRSTLYSDGIRGIGSNYEGPPVTISSRILDVFISSVNGREGKEKGTVQIAMDVIDACYNYLVQYVHSPQANGTFN